MTSPRKLLVRGQSTPVDGGSFIPTPFKTRVEVSKLKRHSLSDEKKLSQFRQELDSGSGAGFTTTLRHLKDRVPQGSIDEAVRDLNIKLETSHQILGDRPEWAELKEIVDDLLNPKSESLFGWVKSKPLISRLLSKPRYLPAAEAELVLRLRTELLYILSGLFRTLDTLEFEFIQKQKAKGVEAPGNHRSRFYSPLGASPPSRPDFFRRWDSLKLSQVAEPLLSPEMQLEEERISAELHEVQADLKDKLDALMERSGGVDGTAERRRRIKVSFLANGHEILSKVLGFTPLDSSALNELAKEVGNLDALIESAALMLGYTRSFQRLSEASVEAHHRLELYSAVVGAKPEHPPDKYETVRKLADSAEAGQVELAFDRFSSRLVCVKTFPWTGISLALNEVNALRSLAGCENIVQLLEVSSGQLPSGQERVSLVMEYAPNGDLLEYLCSLPNDILPEDSARSIFRQVLRGIAFMHSRGIVHGDLKLNNVLLNGQRALLCDFGLCGFVRPGQLFTRFCGTPLYMAPELVICHNSYDEKPYDPRKVDVWSFGIMMFISDGKGSPPDDRLFSSDLTDSLFGELPWDYDDEAELLQAIADSQVVIPNSKNSPAAIAVVKAALNRSPEARPSADELLRFPFFAE